MDKHILIVEDSNTARNLIGFVLKNEGFMVTAASDGIEGLEKLYTGEFDLVITDINMPKMDGYKFIESVRQQEVYRDLPIIVLSTEGEQKDITLGLNLGANLYMVKPIQPEKLIMNVKMLLS